MGGEAETTADDLAADLNVAVAHDDARQHEPDREDGAEGGDRVLTDVVAATNLDTDNVSH